MVNFHDPVVIANEIGECASQPFLSKPECNRDPPSRGSQEVMEFYEWCLHVGLPLLLAFCRSDVPHNSISHS